LLSEEFANKPHRQSSSRRYPSSLGPVRSFTDTRRRRFGTLTMPIHIGWGDKVKPSVFSKAGGFAVFDINQSAPRIPVLSLFKRV